MWLNEMDAEDAVHHAIALDMPVAAEGARKLCYLVDWTNDNSDGWPYWSKPSNAAKKLQDALHARFFSAWDKRVKEDMTEAELKAALTPIKAFLTRQGVKADEVLN